MAATGTVLVVDDDPAICVVVGEALRRQGHKVKTAGSIRERAALMDSFTPDVLITDVMLPDGDGLEGVADIIADRPALSVIILSAQNTLNTAIRATEKGAFEYLPKPFDLNELTRAVSDALGTRQAENGEAEEGEGALPHDGLPLVGRSPAMQEVYRTIARVLSNDLSILVLGESGTGKELVAEAIHSLGQRRTKPFVAINMAAIPRELIEAELFGYEKGAFTGASTSNKGIFRAADGGTLLLDEISEMPMALQAKLLRALQERAVTPIGSQTDIPIDVRVVATTNRNMAEEIHNGNFREDLYYRLNVFPLNTVSLCERDDDIVPIATFLLGRHVKVVTDMPWLDDSAIMALKAHAWPGNVRELENVLQRALVLSQNGVITSNEILIDNVLQDTLGATAGLNGMFAQATASA